MRFDALKPLSTSLTGLFDIFGGSFEPVDISSLMQWSLDGVPYYNTNKLNSYEVLDSKETYGSYRAPRQGRAYRLDGVDDTIAVTLNVLPATISTYVKFESLNIMRVFALDINIFSVFIYSGGEIEFYYNGTSVGGPSTSIITIGQKYHIAASLVGTTATMYVNGVAIKSGTVIPITPGTRELKFGSTVGVQMLHGYMWDMRAYSTGKTITEIQAIMNDQANPDTTGIIGAWWGNEETGTTGYDWSGNGRNLALTNITQSTFHATDTGVTANAANQLGHSYRGNLFYYSEDYTQINSGINAGNSFTATSITFNAGEGYRYKLVNSAGLLTNGDKVRISCRVRSTNGKASVALGGYDGSGFNWKTITLTSSYQTVTLDMTIINISNVQAGLDNRVGFGGDGTTSGTIDVDTWHFRILDPNEAVAYTPTTTIQYPNTRIPRNEANITQDVLGNTLQYTGKSPYPAIIETPCITGDGNVDADLGFRLVPLSGDWSLTLDVFLPSSTPSGFSGFIGQADGAWASAWVVYYDSGWKCSYGNYLSHAVGFEPTLNAWNNITFNKVGTTMTITCNGKVTSGTCASTISITNNTMLLSNRFARVIASISNISCTTGGVTTYVPCQEGDGRHLYFVRSDGLGFGVVADAIVNGTVSTIRGTRRNTIGKDWSVQYGGTITQNLVKYSEDFGNAYWTKSNTNLSFGGSTGPFGASASNVAKLVSTTTPGYYVVTTTPVIDTTGGGTYSIYAKAAGYNWLYIDDGIGPRANFDLQNGVLGNVTAGSTATIESAGNGWYKCSLTTPGGASSYLRSFIGQANDTINFTGNGTDGIYISHAQLTTRPNQIYARTYGDTRDKQFVPGKLTGGIDATGSALTSVAGKFGNPFSRLNQNPFLAAEFNGLNVQTAYEDLPCITGNGSNVYATLGTLGAIDEFDFWFYTPSAITAAGPADYLIGSNNQHSFYLGDYSGSIVSETLSINGASAVNSTYIRDTIPAGWNRVRATWNGTQYLIRLNEKLCTTFSASTHCPQWSGLTVDLLTFNNRTAFSSRPISNFTYKVGSVTTVVPLTDGVGTSLVKYTDGVPSILSSAINGTLTNVWANKTDGSVVPASRFSQRAIITRETKFNRVATTGDDRFLVYKTPLSGGDLTDVVTYTT